MPFDVHWNPEWYCWPDAVCSHMAHLGFIPEHSLSTYCVQQAYLGASTCLGGIKLGFWPMIGWDKNKIGGDREGQSHDSSAPTVLTNISMHIREGENGNCWQCYVVVSKSAVINWEHKSQSILYLIIVQNYHYPFFIKMSIKPSVMRLDCPPSFLSCFAFAPGVGHM